jgi:hypothetical protein
MFANDRLIPPPPVVRKMLAQHLREGRLLRALLRLSIRADEVRFRCRQEAHVDARQQEALIP